MTYDEVMAELKALRNESVYKQNAKRGAGDNQFGVTTGDIRKLAAKIKANSALAEELWKSGNVDAMMLATLLMKPKELTLADLDRLVASVSYSHVADYFSTNVVKLHADREALRERWMDSDNDWKVRLGWSLTTQRVNKDPEGLDVSGLLDRLEAEMGKAPEERQWAMDFCLIDIGVKFPEHRDRAITIGEKLGVFRDYPVSKGCVSPFAPIAIPEMVRRYGK